MNPIFHLYLYKNSTNNVPLIPQSFLKRTISVYPEHIAIINLLSGIIGW